tara:strand:+ start:140 stop:700 length:561 start_codon:yes stop_codon:yes gene_type:complete
MALDSIFHKHFLREISPERSDIFHTKFFTESFCYVIYEMFKEQKEWTDKEFAYSTHDIQLADKFPDLYEIIKERIDNLILPTMGDIWALDHTAESSDIFVVKYSEDTQKELKPHIDQSYISGSIKLNDDYVGGTLMFPRQKVSNQDISPGDLLIWPSQITHEHYSTVLEQGEKYSITIWTDTKNNS